MPAVTAYDYLDILKPGFCALCGECALTFTDGEGDQLCVPCLEQCLEPVPDLPPTEADKLLAREAVAESRAQIESRAQMNSLLL